MLNFNRNDRLPDPKDPKLPARPAQPLGSSAGTTTPPLASGTQARPPAAPPQVTATPAPAAEPAHSLSTAADTPGSKLSIGPNINLKGVEISNCDVLVIEGNVDATITSKVMEIAKPGRFSGTANIDIAEIHGDFSGELTARAKLVVHGTGRVTGTIRYGKLVVAEGGTLTGELKQLDAPVDSTSTSSAAPTPPLPRPLLNPQPH
jgi:cytoskeletal protein CcmA (bactofilin family)